MPREDELLDERREGDRGVDVGGASVVPAGRPAVSDAGVHDAAHRGTGLALTPVDDVGHTTGDGVQRLRQGNGPLALAPSACLIGRPGLSLVGCPRNAMDGVALFIATSTGAANLMAVPLHLNVRPVALSNLWFAASLV